MNELVRWMSGWIRIHTPVSIRDTDTLIYAPTMILNSRSARVLCLWVDGNLRQRGISQLLAGFVTETRSITPHISMQVAWRDAFINAAATIQKCSKRQLSERPNATWGTRSKQGAARRLQHTTLSMKTSTRKSQHSPFSMKATA